MNYRWINFFFIVQIASLLPDVAYCDVNFTFDSEHCLDEAVKYFCTVSASDRTAKSTLILTWSIFTDTGAQFDSSVSYTSAQDGGSTRIGGQFAVEQVGQSPVESGIAFVPSADINGYTVVCEDGLLNVNQSFIVNVIGNAESTQNAFSSSSVPVTPISPPAEFKVAISSSRSDTVLGAKWTESTSSCLSGYSVRITSSSDGSSVYNFTSTQNSFEISVEKLASVCRSCTGYCVSVAPVDNGDRVGEYTGEECATTAASSVISSSSSTSTLSSSSTLTSMSTSTSSSTSTSMSTSTTSSTSTITSTGATGSSTTNNVFVGMATILQQSLSTTSTSSTMAASTSTSSALASTSTAASLSTSASNVFVSMVISSTPVQQSSSTSTLSTRQLTSTSSTSASTSIAASLSTSASNIFVGMVISSTPVQQSSSTSTLSTRQLTSTSSTSASTSTAASLSTSASNVNVFVGMMVISSTSVQQLSSFASTLSTGQSTSSLQASMTTPTSSSTEHSTSSTSTSTGTHSSSVQHSAASTVGSRTATMPQMIVSISTSTMASVADSLSTEPHSYTTAASISGIPMGAQTVSGWTIMSTRQQASVSGLGNTIMTVEPSAASVSTHMSGCGNVVATLLGMGGSTTINDDCSGPGTADTADEGFNYQPLITFSGFLACPLMFLGGCFLAICIMYRGGCIKKRTNHSRIHAIVIPRQDTISTLQTTLSSTIGDLELEELDP